MDDLRRSSRLDELGGAAVHARCGVGRPEALRAATASATASPTRPTASVLAKRIDWQLGEIWRVVEFPADWRERVAEIASQSYEGPDLAALNEKRRRLARAYADGAFGDGEYTALIRAIDEQIRAATEACAPSYEEAATLFADMPALWGRAAHAERQQLLRPLIERVYLDIDSGLIGGIAPPPGFGMLLHDALERVETSWAVILTAHETRNNASDVGLVETGENRTPVTLHAKCLLLPHRLRPEWTVRSIGWRDVAA